LTAKVYSKKEKFKKQFDTAGACGKFVVSEANGNHANAKTTEQKRK
jgi:hypothetical protein